ncbi:hypothetical protein Tco_1187810, partial [Tanacetum coccineum]
AMMTFAEIEQMIAQRVANAIETIAVYKTKTRMACDLMNQVERQEDKLAEKASNKRKWEGDHGGSSSQQQIKGHEVIRAHAARPNIKKVAATTSGLVIKLEIVRLPFLQPDRDPQWQNRRLKSPATSAECYDTTREIAQNGRTRTRGTSLTSWHTTLMLRERPPSYLAEFNSELS